MSKIFPVIFGIIGGYDFLPNKNHELFLGCLLGYGYTSGGGTGVDVTVNSGNSAQYDYVVSFNTSIIARYSYTFNFGLFLGIADSVNILYNAYIGEPAWSNGGYIKKELSPIGVENSTALFIGYRFHF